MYSFGEKLKELRVNRGLSQDELAEKINGKFGVSINKGMISKWEGDLAEPRLSTVRLMALFFNVSLDQLLGLKIKDEVDTVAAHHDGEWTEEELNEIEQFKKFVRMKKNQKE